jgi:hypothetical protein
MIVSLVVVRVVGVIPDDAASFVFWKRRAGVHPDFLGQLVIADWLPNMAASFVRVFDFKTQTCGVIG